MSDMTSEIGEYVALHRRSAGARLLYAVYWLLVILSWPIRVVGAFGLGISIVPVLIGDIHDPEIDDAITGTIVGGVIFGLGFGVRAFADLIAVTLFSPANSFKLATFWAATQKPERAVAAFSRALSACPQMTAARLGRAFCNVGLSQIQDAAQESKAVLEERPDWARAHFVCGVVAEAEEDYEQAAQHYRNALAVSEAALEQKPESLREVWKLRHQFELLHVPPEGVKECITRCEGLAAKSRRPELPWLQPKQGLVGEGQERCPKCGFSYAWDGTQCTHCRYPDQTQRCPKCGFSYAWDGTQCTHCGYPDQTG